MSTKIQLQNLDAEAEADALLREEDERNKLKNGGADGETLEDLEASESLPAPASAASAVPAKISPAPIIVIWICLSSAVITMNAWILKDLRFKYPIFLTTVHLLYATVGTRLLHRFTHLLDGLDNIEMTWDRYYKNIVPIGVLFSASLIFSNLAYLTLSIAFIQMLKAFMSVAVLTLSVAMGLDHFNQRKTAIVVVISLGVAIASYGELNFVFSGFIFQCLGIAFEATRLVAIQKLLQGLRMDPLVSLHYFAPVCAAFNCLLIPLFEGWAPFELVLERVGPVTLFINANVAFLLNIAVVYLIGCASSLVLTLSGVLKDILLVASSVLLFNTPITLIQMLGYAVALTGLVIYKTPQEQTAVWIAKAKALVGR